MSAKQFFSGAATSSSASINTTQTSITGLSTATWPSAGDYIVRIDGFAPGTTTAIFEDVLVTANNQGTGVLTVTRGQDGTVGQAFAANATLTPVITAKMINDAFARIDQTAAQAFSGPITVPSSGGVALPVTSYGSMPIKIDDILVGTDSRYPSASPQITFLNTSGSGTNLLPTGFRHLVVEYYARMDGAVVNNFVQMRFNNISTATYDSEELQAANVTVAASATGGATSMNIGQAPGASATANYFGAGRTQINHYNGTVGNKIAFCIYGMKTTDTGAGFFTESFMGGWRTTGTAITRLDILASSGNFINGSLFTLYGIP